MKDFNRTLAIRDLPNALAQTLFQSVLSSSPRGVLITDLQHKSIACNRRFGEIWGVDFEKVVLSDVEEVRHMVSHRVLNFQAWEQNLKEVYADPMIEQRDVLELASPTVLVDRYTAPILTTEGELMGRLWAFEDVTTQIKRSRRHEILYRAALTTDPNPATVYKAITHLASDYFRSCAILSLRQGDYMKFLEVAGAIPPADTMDGNDLSDSFCQFCVGASKPVLIQDARKEGRGTNLSAVKIGLTRYAGVPIISSSGTAIGTLCILDNKSDELLTQEDMEFLSVLSNKIAGELQREDLMRRLESDLDKTRHSLEDTHWQLVQSEKLAVTGTLGASIAHDIRNILATVRLRISMSAHEPETALLYVDSQLSRFEILAHRLLSYAKPSQYVSEPVNLHDVVLNVVTLLAAAAQAHDIALATDFQAEDPWINGDPSRLEHLFVNLILNGLQALRPGGKIIVSTSVTESAVSVRVCDNGPGIPFERQATLFEPFTSTRSDGFGLGLFSCREIAKTHGGSITCESSERTGTTFTINLPRAK